MFPRPIILGIHKLSNFGGVSVGGKGSQDPRSKGVRHDFKHEFHGKFGRSDKHLSFSWK